MWRALLLLAAELALGTVSLAAWSTAPTCLTGTATTTGRAAADGTQATCAYVGAHVALPGSTGLLIATLVVLHLAAAAVAAIRLWNQTRAASPTRSVPAPDRLRRRTDALGISARVVDGPPGLCHTTGLLRPHLTISLRTVDLLVDDELNAVLAHEAAHIRRRHPLQTLVARAFLRPLRPIRWILPLLRMCRLHAELQADTEAITTHGVRPLASAMLKLAAPTTLPGVTGATSLLPARVAALAGDAPTPNPSAPIRCALAATAAVALVLAALPLTSAVDHAQSTYPAAAQP